MALIVSKLNMSLFEGGDVILTKSELNRKIKKGNYEMFTPEGVNNYLADINNLISKGQEGALSEEEFASVEKAESEIRSLEPCRFYDEDGSIGTVYLRKAEKSEDEGGKKRAPKEGMNEKSVSEKEDEIEEEEEDEDEDDEDEDESKKKSGKEDDEDEDDEEDDDK